MDTENFAMCSVLSKVQTLISFAFNQLGLCYDRFVKALQCMALIRSVKRFYFDNEDIQLKSLAENGSTYAPNI